MNLGIIFVKISSMDFFFTFSLGRRKFNEESRDTRIRNEGKRKIRKKKRNFVENGTKG